MPANLALSLQRGRLHLRWTAPSTLAAAAPVWLIGWTDNLACNALQVFAPAPELRSRSVQLHRQLRQIFDAGSVNRVGQTVELQNPKGDACTDS